MISADLTRADEKELLERFNIVGLSYSNSDGKHAQLRRLLALMDKFIKPRKQRIDLAALRYSPEELEAAQAVAIYRRLSVAKTDEIQPVTYLGPLITQALRAGSAGLRLEDLVRQAPLSSAVQTEAVRQLVPQVLTELQASGVVTVADGVFRLTEIGLDQATALSKQRAIEEDQAYGQFVAEVRKRYDTLSLEQESQIRKLACDTLVGVFRQRGLSIANAIFAGRSLEHDALSDVFHAISSAAVEIKNQELSLAFMEAAQSFVLHANEPQKRYLASLSQGYFLYHLFGLDPQCAKIRRELFEHTIWWCDASSVLPLLAMGCANHEYARDLFSRLQQLNAYTLTTGRLLREIVQHLDWVVRLIERESLQSATVLAAATQKGSYKQNLFLDGYIRLSAEGKVSKFQEYLKFIAPYGLTEPAMRKVLQDHHITAVNVEELAGYQDSDKREMFELAYEIREARTRSATLRGDLQIEAEAEILQIIRKLQSGAYKPPVPDMTFERSYFVSQSRVLDRIPPSEPVSWTPEALYRYIMALPGEAIDPELLQRCMLQEYFGAGVVLLDELRYEKFFGPSINAANTTYGRERDAYLTEFAEMTAAELDETFATTPELEKPFFVQQMGFRLAAREQARAEAATLQAELAKKRAEEAQLELLRVKREADSDWQRRRAAREHQLLAEERNRKDPKHQKKRERQAKKRKRKQ